MRPNLDGLEPLNLLINNGACLHRYDPENGMTALHYICQQANSYEKVVALLDKDATLLLSTDYLDQTLLHKAVVFSCNSIVLRYAIIRLLLERGADPLALDINRRTPIDLFDGHDNMRCRLFTEEAIDTNNTIKIDNSIV